MQRRALKGSGSSSPAIPEPVDSFSAPSPPGKVYDDGTNTFFWYVLFLHWLVLWGDESGSLSGTCMLVTDVASSCVGDGAWPSGS